MKKKCNTCGDVKNTDDFYVRKDAKCGLRSDCKACLVLKGEAYRNSHIQEKKEYRRRNKDRIKEYRSRPEVKERLAELMREYTKNNPLKVKARNTIKYAINSGRVKRQPCEVCGASKVEAHHSDYSKPLDVNWLCYIHHKELHSACEIEEVGV